MGWLERFGLIDRAGDRLDSLSKGNQQKVQFACAILHEPVLVVLDEPFSGLDPVNQQMFLDILDELRQAGTTILLCAHQMDLVEQVADRILLMNRGRAVLSGTLADLRDQSGAAGRLVVRVGEGVPLDSLRGHPAVLRLELATDHSCTIWLSPDASLASLLEHLGREFDVLAIESRPPHLREVFLQAVAAATPLEDAS
jgi:ABC-2 type transport system ATP-binding protein